MIRKAASFLAISPVFVLACSAGPTDHSEVTGTSDQSLTTCGVGPFNEEVTVGVNPSPPPGGGVKPEGHLTGAPRDEISYCKALTGPSPTEAPDGGYPYGALSSCAGATIVYPPENLPGCTLGYEFWGGMPTASAQVFVCPVQTVLPPNVYSLKLNVEYAVLESPDDGCLGPILDPTDWEYVTVSSQVQDCSLDTWNLPICGQPQNCGSDCPRY